MSLVSSFERPLHSNVVSVEILMPIITPVIAVSTMG